MLTITMNGFVFNIQKYSLHDGPGIRTTVFLKGCPLRCWWCHNPEGMSPDPEILVAEGRCTACGRCRDACPQDGVRPACRDAVVQSVPPSCVRCGACVEACPTQARQLLGRQMTATEVVTEIEKDHIFYDDSHGGVTCSGGEPLLQTPFLLELLRACRQREIDTAVDTTGFAGQDALLAVARWTNLFLYDIKILDDTRHRQYTGVSNASILENLKLLGQEHGNIWVRVPIVPGLNDAHGDLEATVRFAASVPGVKQVNLLTYHHTGAYKFSRLGKPYLAESVRPPAPEFLARTAVRLRGLGVPIVVGGSSANGHK
jgi:pyruvate formate lyase activating enzyme